MRVDLDAVTLQAKAAWRANAGLREEFVGNEAAYLAGCRAEASGKCKVHRGAGIVTYKPEAGQRFTTDAVQLAWSAIRPGSKIELSLGVGRFDRGHISGLAAVFGGVNRKGCRLLRGAFRRSVDRVPLALLLNHRSDRVAGQWTELRETDAGLHAEGSLNLNIDAGREAYELLRSRDVTGLSVGFAARAGGFKFADDDAMEFSDVDLIEISVTPTPAEIDARVVDVQGA